MWADVAAAAARSALFFSVGGGRGLLCTCARAHRGCGSRRGGRRTRGGRRPRGERDLGAGQPARALGGGAVGLAAPRPPHQARRRRAGGPGRWPLQRQHRARVDRIWVLGITVPCKIKGCDTGGGDPGAVVGRRAPSPGHENSNPCIKVRFFFCGKSPLAISNTYTMYKHSTLESRKVKLLCFPK